MTEAEFDQGPNGPAISMSCSRGLPAFLLENGFSFTFTSYQSGRVYWVGVTQDGSLSVHERNFERAMAVHAAGDTMLLSTAWQIWRFENDMAGGQRTAEGADRCYVPRMAWVTGELDIHEIGILSDGRLIFVNTLHSCLATISQTRSFTPYWKPGFISALAPEDRCHLNGMAMRDGMPTHVTAISASDIVGGWRDRRGEGGCIIDVASGEILTQGLSMPHSPRWHDGRLWVLNSGEGDLGTVDTKTGKFTPCTFLPGFLRGLAFHGKYALVGLSKPRDGAFAGLALDERLAQRDADPRCGVYVVNTQTGHVVEWLEFNGLITEVFAVDVLPAVRMPVAVGCVGNEIRTRISIDM